MNEEEEFFASLELESDGDERREKIKRKSVRVTGKSEKGDQKSWSPGKFIRDMKLFEDEVGEEVEFCPYEAVILSYDEMNEGQRDWYFYWRSKVRGKWYLFTDRSYIELLIYEYLHCVGGNEQECYEYLVDLWVVYGEKDEILWRNLQCLILDFIIIYGLSPSLFMGQNKRKKLTDQQYNVLLYHCSLLKNVEIPFYLLDIKGEDEDVLEKLEQIGLMQQVQRIFHELAGVVNEKCLALRGKNLFELYGTTKKVTYSGFYYQKMTIICSKPSYTVVVEDHMNYDKLFLFFHAFFRFTLHMLMKQWDVEIDVEDAPIGRELEKEISEYLEEFHSKPVFDLHKKQIKYSKIEEKGEPFQKSLEDVLEEIEEKLSRVMERKEPTVSKLPKEVDSELAFWKSISVDYGRKTKKMSSSTEKNVEGEVINHSLGKGKGTSKASADIGEENTLYSGKTGVETVGSGYENGGNHGKTLEIKPLQLDFSQISKLREESDLVREALAVEEPTIGQVANSGKNDDKPKEEILPKVEEISSSKVGESTGEFVGKEGEFLDVQNNNEADTSIDWKERFKNRPTLGEIYADTSECLIKPIEMESEHKTDGFGSDSEIKEKLFFSNVSIIVGENDKIEEVLQCSGESLGLSGDLCDFWNGLVGINRQVLVFIVKKQWDLLEELAQSQFYMTDMLVDELNQVAMDVLGDIIVEGQGEESVVVEEYGKLCERLLEM